MARQTRGWYTFADGYTCWVNGFSAREKQAMVRQHGQIIKFIGN